MSVFDAIRKAVLRSDGTVITEAYSSTDQIGVEMADLANECAADIAKSYGWRALTKVATFTGDGTETAFPFPSDYDRMSFNAVMADPLNWFWGYQAYSSVDEWMAFVNGGFGLIQPGGWIILGDAFNFYPAPAAGSRATFPYISTQWARSEDGTPKASFTSDNDTFALNERLLTLALTWRWKAQKGLDYSEDMGNYELALSQEQTRDHGARVIRETRPPRYGNVSISYPWALG